LNSLETRSICVLFAADSFWEEARVLAIAEHKPGPGFVGPRVRLRPILESDLPILMKWDNDPDITRWAGKRFEDDADAREWYLARRNLQRKTFAIESNEHGLIGEIEVINISWRLHTAELRIFIGQKELWNRGLGEEAVRVLVSGFFENTTLREIFLKVDEDNLRAQRCYRKVGFRPKGRIRFCTSTGRGGDTDGDADGYAHGDGDTSSTLVLMTLTPETFRR
jgi:RimJ/RimL family protein N-acetyltransferase